MNLPQVIPMRKAVPAVLGLAWLVAGCEIALNEDVEVEAGAERRGDSMTLNGDVLVGKRAVIASGELKTVNGRIQIAEGARVRSCSTVNGSIEVGAEAETGDLASVNGNLILDHDARVTGDIRLVNGQVQLRPGVHVSGDVGTVNGRIELRAATVEGDVSNYQGGMTVTDGSRVGGGLTVLKPSRGADDDVPTILIGPRSEVRGVLEFERPVHLYVHESARIGPVSGAEVQRYAGDQPEAG